MIKYDPKNIGTQIFRGILMSIGIVAVIGFLGYIIAVILLGFSGGQPV